MRTQDAFPVAEPILVHCAECGAGLLLAPNKAKTRTFCSRLCLYASQRKARAAGLLPLPPGHATDAGRQKSLENLALGREGTRAWWDTAPYRWVSCCDCHRLFPTRATSVPQYCSGTCRTRAVTRQGRYTITAPCAYCMQPFTTNKYRPRRTCSKSCAQHLVWVERTAEKENKEPGCLSA